MPTDSLGDLLDTITTGDSVYIAGSTGEPTALLDAWSDDPDRTRDLSILTSMVPGINAFDLDSLHASARVTGLFMQPRFAAAQREGRYRHLPLSYAGFVRRLRDPAFALDVCVVQVAPPDHDGRCSLGLAAEFMPLAIARAKRVVALVNEAMPVMPGAPSIKASVFERIAQVDTALRTYNTGVVDPAARRLAATIAGYIEDGAALQVGLGKAPAALMDALADRRGLRLQSGMYGDGVRTLADAGALDEAWAHQACVAVGSQSLYDRAPSLPNLHVVGCEVSHDPARLAATERLVAVNSALEVDLFGQCNLEHAEGRAVSGCGGAPDFARGARMSAGGLSIVALPSTAARGTCSRIVSRLSTPSVASLARYDVDVVITEHGAADLRGRSVLEIAEALIEVADPRFQDALVGQWCAIADAL